MTTSIKIEIDADRALATIHQLQRRSLNGLTETLGALVKGQTQRRLAAEKTAPDGTPWAPLAPLTVQARTNKSNSPLTNKGRLMGSISYTSGRHQAIVGTNVEYAGFHQYGVESIKPKKGKSLRIPFAGGGFAFARETSIPARPFMGISDRNMKEIRAAVDAWLEAKFA